MKKFILGTVFCLTLAGVAGALYYGNTPVKTYYPNGALKSEVHQKFFKKEGAYKEYYASGVLKLEVSYQNNVKNGIQKEYFLNGGRLEIPFVNGIKNGTAHLYSADNREMTWQYQNNQLTGSFQLSDEVTGQFLPNNRFELTFSNDPKGTAHGSVVCDDSVFGKAFAEPDKITQALDLAKCVSIEQFDISNEQVDVVFNGAYQFPRFTKKSVIDLTDKTKQFNQAYDSIKDIDENMAILKNFIASKARITVEEDNKHVSIEGIKDDKSRLSYVQFDMHDIAALTEISVKSAQENKMPPELFNVVKNISITEITSYSALNKPELSFKGAFTPFLAQFAPDTTFNLYNLDGQNIWQITGVKNGIRKQIAYPKTAQNLISFELTTDLSYLKELQSRLKKITSPAEYQGLFMEVALTAMSNLPATFEIKNLIINEADGRLVAKTDELSINWQTRQIKGKVDLNTPKQGLIHLTFTGDNQSIIVETENGERKETGFEYLPQLMKQMDIENIAHNIAQNYAKQTLEIAETGQSVLFSGFKVGYENAMRAKANSILDNATKYAIIVYTSQETYKSTHNNDLSGFKMPSFCETGLVLPCVVEGATFDNAVIENNQVSIKINFDNSQTCQNVATIIEKESTTCAETGRYINYTINMK